MFPAETWVQKSERVFMAESRKPVNSTEKAKLEKELLQADILAEHGHLVYLVPERAEGKNVDSLTDGIKTELKHVTGNIKTLGTQFKYALKQGDNIFIRTQEKTAREIYSKLIGETKTLLAHNVSLREATVVYVWIDEESHLYEWQLQKIISIARKLLKNKTATNAVL